MTVPTLAATIDPSDTDRATFPDADDQRRDILAHWTALSPVEKERHYRDCTDDERGVIDAHRRACRDLLFAQRDVLIARRRATRLVATEGVR